MKDNPTKPYFLLEYDESVYSDEDSLEQFYRYLFHQYKTNKKNEFTVHSDFPIPLQQRNNTGFLLSRSVSQGLETVIKAMQCSRNKRRNQVLKKFIYLDGTVRNNKNLTIRVVKEYDGYNKKPVKYVDGAFMIVHYFFQKKNTSEIQQKQPTSETLYKQPTINQFQQVSNNQQQNPLFKAQDLKRNERQQQQQQPEKEKPQFNQKDQMKQQYFSSHRHGQIKAEVGLFDEEDETAQMNQGQEKPEQITTDDVQQKIQKHKIQIKEEFQQLDEKVKISVLIEQSQYFQNKYYQEKEISLKSQIKERDLERKLLLKELEEVQKINVQREFEKSSFEKPIIIDFD